MRRIDRLMAVSFADHPSSPGDRIMDRGSCPALLDARLLCRGLLRTSLSNIAQFESSPRRTSSLLGDPILMPGRDGLARVLPPLSMLLRQDGGVVEHLGRTPVRGSQALEHL